MHSFINSNNNYHFSKFNDSDLKEYLSFLKNYFIEYREKLYLDKKTPFGLEIEYESTTEEREEVDNFLTRFKHYESRDENDFGYWGGEVVTPILNNSRLTWTSIKEICKKLKELDVVTNKKAGAHVHIGAHLLSDLEKFKQFIMLYSSYENVIYRFSNGEYITGRENQYASAYPISLYLIDVLDDIVNASSFDEIDDLFHFMSRFQGLNLKNINFDNIKGFKYKNTIEFRMANGSKEEIIWQNIVNLYCKMIESSKNKEFDFDFLLYKINLIANNINYTFFDKYDLNGALELSDMVFDNNLDKSNFIRQYIKDGSDLTKLNDRPLEIKSPIFIKK